MKPYNFKRSGRSWVNYFFFWIGLCLVCAGVVGLVYGFGTSDFVWFALLGGALSLFGGGIGLVCNAVWELNIDENHLIWKSGAKGGVISTGEIKKYILAKGIFDLLS